MLFYVFDTEAEALAAEAEISLIGGAPVAGVDSKGNPKEGLSTTSWAVPWQRVTDGKWVFPKVPTAMIIEAGQEVEDAFNATFNYVFEDYDQSWRPEEEEV